MKSSDVRKKYIEFFTARGHVEIPSAPLVPENDPTTLFTSSGMQPLIPYLLGQKHPSGKRLVDSQKSFRAQDIEEIGDNRHTTFFEMLGNWSLGDYFKKEQLSWIWEFLTKELLLDPKRLYVTVFKGNDSVPRDTESIEIWKEIFAKEGIDTQVADPSFAKASEGARIFLYDARKNWWSRSGAPENMPPGEPGGPDSEVFFDFGTPHDVAFGKACHPNCDCGRFMEIANSVFMQYQKNADGSLKELAQKNVDFGGGLERMTAATNNDPDVYKTDIFWPTIEKIMAESKKPYEGNTRSMRIIADHVRGATMMMEAGVFPSNKGQGYVLRRLIRRALWYAKKLGCTLPFDEEAKRFDKALARGMELIGKTSPFDLFQTYGIPGEIIQELFADKGLLFDKEEFEKEFTRHQELSRTAAKGMFKGGLADHSVQTTRLHTAHHLLLASLQKIVDPTIKQRGSNITAERLRMDVNFSRKFTPEEIASVEKLVNEKIQEDIRVERVEMPREEAEKIGAQMEFGHKYPDMVSVYIVGDKDKFFSAEFCGGPHVMHTGEIGTFKIFKEESAGSGIRRIYANISV